jgi:hypothetical protein
MSPGRFDAWDSPANLPGYDMISIYQLLKISDPKQVKNCGGALEERALEELWENLLSRQPELIRLAFARLAVEEQREVIAHLQRMRSEAGWHIEQRFSAEAALASLQDWSNAGLEGG